MNKSTCLPRQPFAFPSLVVCSVLLFLAALLGGCVVPTASAVTAAAAIIAAEDVPTLTPAATTDAATDATAQVEPREPAQPDVPAPDSPTGDTNGPIEQAIVTIPLATPLDDPELEFSGMAWHGDRLVLLPQYPERYQGQLPFLERGDILAFLRSEQMQPLQAGSMAFDGGGLSVMISGFQGYEAIAFDADQAYLTIETRPGSWMLGYVVAGNVSPQGDALQLDPMQRAPVPVQASLGNMADETLVIDGDRVITVYEANGVAVNSDPVANVYSRSLEKLEPIAFPNIEYRITDATEVDDDRRFWAINYFFPGDEKLLPEVDPLVVTYGEGPTHRSSQPVERLVEFQIEDDAIHLVDAPPIQLALSPLRLARNWEGIVRLADDDINGFLLVTDKFPGTILAFVPMPDGR